jgi:hypothetical protein
MKDLRCWKVRGAVCGLVMVGAANGLAEGASGFRYGADERARWEYMDHIPLKTPATAYSRNGENDYFRFRTRLWAGYNVAPGLSINARGVNESRAWLYPDVTERPQRSTAEWPDEWVFDILNVTAKDLFDRSLDLCVGRQELMYGNGRLLGDGTPGDGSRTHYFNALKATLKAIPDTEVDLLGLYNEPEDELALNSADRDLTAYGKAREGVTESGAGVYLKQRSLPHLPFEVYALYKHEGEWDQAAKTNAAGQLSAPAYAWQSLDAARRTVHTPGFDIGTIGFRLMPVFSDTLAGNLEAAAQFGDRGGESQHGALMDASLSRTFVAAASPVVKAGVYVLSGDDPGTATDEGWNPLWARSPQFSDLVSFSYDTEDSLYRWSNLVAPNVGLTLTPAKTLKTAATVYYLAALEDDGNGGGKERGWLAQLRQDVTLFENRWLPKDKLTSYVLVEAFRPGDYYEQEDTAVFARWEFLYAF